MFGDIDLYRGLVGRLALTTRSRVIFVRYRLTPEHRFPAALEDVYHVYAETVREGNDAGVPHHACWLMGDSCGASLALGTAILARDGGVALPKGLVLLDPLVDLTASGRSYQECAATDPVVTREMVLSVRAAYLGDGSAEDPRASPLFADLRGIPPMLLLASSTEVLRDDSVRLATRAGEAGVRAELQLWPDMVHDWPLIAPRLPEAVEAITKVGAFVNSTAGGAQY